MNTYTIEEIRKWMERYGAPSWLHVHLTDESVSAAQVALPEKPLTETMELHGYNEHHAIHHPAGHH